MRRRILIPATLAIAASAFVVAQTNRPAPHAVHITVGGGSTSADVRYAIGAEEQQTDTVLPFDLDAAATPGTYLLVSAWSQQSGLSITCEITSGGKTIAHSVSNTAGNVACSGWS